jgi:hypothetical protein
VGSNVNLLHLHCKLEARQSLNQLKLAFCSKKLWTGKEVFRKKFIVPVQGGHLLIYLCIIYLFHINFSCSSFILNFFQEGSNVDLLFLRCKLEARQSFNRLKLAFCSKNFGAAKNSFAKSSLLTVQGGHLQTYLNHV